MFTLNINCADIACLIMASEQSRPVWCQSIDIGFSTELINSHAVDTWLLEALA